MIFLDPAMSKTDEEDLPCMLEGVEGQTGDKKAPVCEMGHKDRERLETLLQGCHQGLKNITESKITLKYR